MKPHKKTQRDGLTAQQRNFCRGITEGMSVCQAYIAAGYSPKSASASASRLHAKPFIQAELKRLSDKLDNRNIMSKQARLELLTACALDAKESGDINGVVRAIDALNKMTGAYAPEKKEISVTGQINILGIVAAIKDAPLTTHQDT